MESAAESRKAYFSIVAFYFFIFMSNSVYSYFLPLYLSEAGGYGASQRGILLSITPFVATDVSNSIKSIFFNEEHLLKIKLKFFNFSSTIKSIE